MSILSSQNKTILVQKNSLTYHASVKKYFGIFKNRFATNMEYRSNLVAVLLLELMSMFSILVLWISVYRDNKEVGGYSLNEALTYYLIIPLIGFLTYVTISEDLPREIKWGSFSNQLIKPYNIWLGYFMDNLAKKAIILFLVVPLYILILIGYSYKIGRAVTTFDALSLAFIACICAFLMHSFMDLAVSWLTFWYDDVWAFRHLKDIIFSILGGVMFPFEFLPEKARAVFELLPFKYMYYIPVSYILQKRGFSYLTQDIMGIAFWSFVFIFLGLILWSRGLRRYGAFGK